MPSNYTNRVVIQVLKQIFSVHGIPDILINDNGPQYSSGELNLSIHFRMDWKTKSLTNSPHYTRSNGFMERNAQTVESNLKKHWKVKVTFIEHFWTGEQYLLANQYRVHHNCSTKEEHERTFQTIHPISYMTETSSWTECKINRITWGNAMFLMQLICTMLVKDSWFVIKIQVQKNGFQLVIGQGEEPRSYPI